jgi:hypothetical protein
MHDQEPVACHLQYIADTLKPGWCEWYCELHYPGGEVVEGTVQADSQGELVAMETFESAYE